VNSGEMPIELGDSWFSAKIITVMRIIKKFVLSKALLEFRVEQSLSYSFKLRSKTKYSYTVRLKAIRF